MRVFLVTLHYGKVDLPNQSQQHMQDRPIIYIPRFPRSPNALFRSGLTRLSGRPDKYKPSSTIIIYSPLKMTLRGARDNISETFRSIKSVFKIVKRQPTASKEAGSTSSNPPEPEVASSSTAVPLLPDQVLSKRKPSTSAPSSPLSSRPPRKRRILTLLRFRTPPANAPLLSPPFLSSPPPASIPRETAIPPVAPRSRSPIFDKTNLFPEDDQDSASDRSASECWSCLTTDSVASNIRDAWAPRARARDLRDVDRVLRTLRQVRTRKYSVKNGGPGGKYLIQRVLHYSGYKRLLEVELRKEENKDLLKYEDNGREIR